MKAIEINMESLCSSNELEMMNLDNNGYIFTIDALLSLILITVIIGISADAMDITGNKITDYSSEQSYGRIIEDTSDILIKTPGSPENWESDIYLNHVTPGLREVNSTPADNKLSMTKINYLKSNPYLMEKLLPEGLNCSLMIYPVDQTLPPITIINRTPNRDDSDVYVVNRTISYEYNQYKIYSSIKMNNIVDNYNTSIYMCPHSFLSSNEHKLPDYKKSQPGWICTQLKINVEDVNSTDFYLITDPQFVNDKDSMWLIDRPDNTSGIPQKFLKTPVNINYQIHEMWDGNGILVLHVFTSGLSDKLFNLYLVGVPAGTPLNYVKNEYLGLKNAYFILKLWN
jgi:hypothetical protein